MQADKYGISGGLHGTGLKAVTALSSHLKATVWRDAKEHTLVFNDAKVVQKLDTKKAAKGHETRTGTMIEFRLDPARFPDATSTVPARERLQRMLRERAYLNPGLKLYLRWKGEKEELFHEKSGIDAYVSELAGDGKIFPKVAHFDNAADSEIRVSVALAWTKGYGRDNVLGFCNCVRQPDGGTHVTGLRLAMPGIVRSYIESNGLLTAKDKDLKIEGPDCFEGVYAIVSIKHRSPVFKGQAKTVLANSDAQGAVQKAVNAGLAQWLEENPKEAKALSARAIAAAKARIAASKAREQVRKQDAGTFGMKNFGKLKDCSSKDPVKNELFVVEGDSAGGSASMSRDRGTQAVYALKGKPLNSWEADQAKVFSNAELSDLTCAIGTGLFTPEMTPEEVDAAMAKLRYHKIIVMADADIDGCFTYETSVLTTEGPKTIGELADAIQNSDFKVYTGWAIDVDTGEKIEVPLRVPRKTKDVTELVEIVFDNQHVVRCTPDHPFRLKDGTYVSAANLTPDMEIEDGIPENDSGFKSVGS